MPAPHECIAHTGENCQATALLDYRVQSVEVAVKEISTAVRAIAANTEQIARLEERHAETRDAMNRAFAQISNQDDRLKAIEIAMPGVVESSSYVKRAIMWVVGAVAAAIIGLVVVAPKLVAPQAVVVQPAK